MFKKLFLATVLLLLNVISFGQMNAEDYHVYAAVINTEIGGNIKSVAIIKNSIDNKEKKENTFLTIEQLTSSNLNDRQQVYLWTENNKKQRPSTIDSSKTQLILDYCKSNVDKFIFTNNFNQAYKTVIIKKSPIRRKSIQQDWKTFYEKYPGSAGIFSFSKIKYYTGYTTAIVYYSVRRNGLNGHGALVVMTKNDGGWQMEYKTYLWYN